MDRSPPAHNQDSFSPVRAALEKLSEKNPVLSVNLADFDEYGFLAIFSGTQRSFPCLQEVVFTNAVFQSEILKSFGEAIRQIKFLKKVSITSSHFPLEAFKSFAVSLTGIEYLDLSLNSLTDLYADHLSPLFRSRLTTLILNQNKFRSISFSQYLPSSNILKLYLNDNPLSFNSVIRLLDSLLENKVLESLSILGLSFNETALAKNKKISKEKAVFLKLSSVLKKSPLRHLAIDLKDSGLNELKNTLVHHNRTLCSLESRGINWAELWDNKRLKEIWLALQANSWLVQGNPGPVPLDIKEMVDLKKSLDTGLRAQIFELFEKVVLKIEEIDRKVLKKVEKIEGKIEDLVFKETEKDCKIEDIEESVSRIKSRTMRGERAKVDPSEEEADNEKIKEIEKLVKIAENKVLKIEEKDHPERVFFRKLSNFENRICRIEKDFKSLSGLKKRAKEAERDIKSFENFINSSAGVNEYEGIFIGNILHKINKELNNSPGRTRSAYLLRSSCPRTPSSSLKETLRKRGLNFFD